MISPSFKIREFLKAVEDMDYNEIIHTGEQECREADKISYGVKGAVKARNMGSTEYIQELKNFLHFIRWKGHPASVSQKENPLYRPVCESLIRKGQLPPSILELFD